MKNGEESRNLAKNKYYETDLGTEERDCEQHYSLEHGPVTAGDGQAPPTLQASGRLLKRERAAGHRECISLRVRFLGLRITLVP